MKFYDFEIKPDWNKRNKLLLHVSADTTFDTMVGIIINDLGLDCGHLYEFTVVKDGTTRKQQLERGSKVIDDGTFHCQGCGSTLILMNMTERPGE